jgi:hypothetical protein
MASKPTVQLEHHDAKDRRDIGRQVDRLLSHPLFRLSKRLPAFLQYIVDVSLNQGSDGPPKERTIGVEVFGRRPDYDTNSDPIVRVTATELRKKLAQYYYEDGHNDEIRIELPPGSYLPKFRRSVAADRGAEENTEVRPTDDSSFLVEVEHPIVLESSLASDDSLHGLEPPKAEIAGTAFRDHVAEAEFHPETHASTPESPRRWGRIVALLCVLLIVAGAAGFFPQIWRRFSPLDDFWYQFAGNSNRVLIVMPVIEGNNNRSDSTNTGNLSVVPNLSLEDTNIAARVASQIERQEAHYSLISSPEVTLDQLRTGPFVLIGALDNVWTMRLTKDLPFVFEETDAGLTGQIVDASSGGRKRWSVDITTPHTRITRDYGIVACYTNRLTGEPTIVIAGISSQGTQAAGELLTSSSSIKTIRSVVGRSRNFELVIETEAIDGHTGPPQIVASKSW